MLAILFPHMYEDIEYLVPDDDVAMQEQVEDCSPVREHVNAEAGPSRLIR
jgi:E3 ubiquitin-protein ligase SHPRH